MKNVVEALQLEPHPEGGYFREYYRSPEVLPEKLLHPRFAGDRVTATSIYYLLPEGERSVFHRIQSDEIWVAFAGGALEIVELHPSFGNRKTVISKDIELGHLPSHVVPAGHWFAARPVVGAVYSASVCVVAPGFEFADFQIGSREELLHLFPEESSVIERFTNE